MSNSKLHAKSDPKELARSFQFWTNFNKIAKWFIIGTASLLILMAVFLV